MAKQKTRRSAKRVTAHRIGHRGDDSARHALAHLEARLDAALARGDAAMWDAGALFDRIAREESWRAAGEYASLAEYADARFPSVGWRTLSRYRRVAQRFPRETAIAHGVFKLDLGLAYVEAHAHSFKHAPTNQSIARAVLALQVHVDGRGHVPFAEVTPQDLERALAASHTPAHPTPHPLPRGETARLARLERELARGLPKGAAPTIETTVHRDAAGAHVVYTFHGVPGETLPRFAEALRRATKS